MVTYLRSAGAPLVLTLGLLGVLALGVLNLERHKHAACADSSLALRVPVQGPKASVGSRGGAYLSRFDRAEIWACEGPDTGRHAAIAP